MNAAPTYRWGIGFIAMRWRHVFWLLPLLGALLGLGQQYWKLYGPTATGLVQVSSFGISPMRTSPAETARLLQSDEVLSKTETSLDLSGRWSTDPSSGVARLRRMIRCEVIAGTSLIELRVSDTTRSEAIEIWSTLASLANQDIIDARQAAADAKRAADEAALEALELDLEEKRQKLASALTQKTPATDRPGETPTELEHLRADFEAAKKTYYKELIRLFPSVAVCGIPVDPITIQEAPPIFSLNRRNSIRPLAHHAGLGLSIGVILTPLLAYLLELIFPRRQPEAHAET
ncbi:hypothetical protein [Luteolibacter soli]|uniref:Polysaccharide chain length determinant N-terminal domain-containing protein n=1 Tax=Luteolibacter soli TaxID=3135280 RepID=A0ABU9APB2_9BACT